MNKALITAIILFFAITIPAVNAHADLDAFLSRINNQAKADLNGFSIKLSAQFGVPLPQVKIVMDRVDTAADAFMCFQLGRMTNKQPETVVQTYSNNRGKGWGVIAKELGIKPGSSEFHALKRGEFDFPGEPGRGSKEKDKAKGKGHKK
jgi:hypothetical protein